MFGFFKQTLTVSEYRTEYKRLTTTLWEQHSVEDIPFDQLLNALCVIDSEMNRNGGANWTQGPGNYEDHLNILRETLTIEKSFNEEQKTAINSSIDQILRCGDELDRRGESGVSLDTAFEILIARTVDWCRAHPRP